MSRRAAAALLAFAAVAAAQEEPPRLDDIVVTAQKSEQLLEQVPLSITALDGELLSRTGANDLYDLSLQVPNLRIDGDDLGATSLYIRGFGSNSFNSSVDSGIGFIQDDIFYGRNGYVTDALFDVDRIEILRGPQGTLFGKNTVAGLVSVTSRAPGNQLALDLRYRRGSFDEARVEGGLDLPLGDRAAARISGMYRDEAGQLHNRLLGRSEGALDQHGARAKVRATPLDGVVAELTFVDTCTATASWPLQLLALDADTREYLEQFDPAVEDDPLDFATSFDARGYLHKGSRTLSLKTRWDIGVLGAISNLDATAVVGASRFWTDRLSDIDVSPADLARLANRVDYRQGSAELRLAGSLDHGLLGSGDTAEFVAGGFWFESSTILQSLLLAGEDLASFTGTCDFRQLAARRLDACTAPAPPPPPLATSPGDDNFQFDFAPRVRSAALFGQFAWQLTDHWAVVPALRLTREDKVADVAGTSHCPGRLETPQRPCVVETIVGAEDYDQPGLHRAETDWAPRLAVQYFTDADDNLYASYSIGHKSGGFNFATYDGKGIEFEPEKARSWEVGAKGRAFGDTLRFGIDLFDTEFENLQVLQIGADVGLKNAASARSRGAEADLTWLTPLPALSLAAAAGYVDARYRRYPDAVAPIASGIGATQDLGGRRLAYSPRVTGALMPQLRFLLGSLAARIGADVLYQGDQYTDADLDPHAYVPGYWKLGARLQVSRPDDAWSVTVGGTNLTDRRVLNQVTDAILFPGTYFAQQAGGRALFATLGARF